MQPSSKPAPLPCGVGPRRSIFLQPLVGLLVKNHLAKPCYERYKTRPINENRWRRQWTIRCLPPSQACARGTRRRTRPDGGFRSSAFSTQVKPQPSESADRFFRLSQWICIMTAHLQKGGVPPRKNNLAKADPATRALERGNDVAPATLLSGAFKAALGKPAGPPHSIARDMSGIGHAAPLSAGPLKGPGKPRTNSPAASVPRKGHR